MNNGDVQVYYCDTIKNPHEKIALCVCHIRNYVFWFNSERNRLHGLGQLPISKGEHRAITKDCFLDLSELRQMTGRQVATSKPRGPVSDELRDKILKILGESIKTLPDDHRNLAVRNLKQK